jgi:hypothetical protein
VPTGVAIDYSDKAFIPRWTEAPGARRAVQRAALLGELTARSLTTPMVTTAYNVYRTTRQAGAAETGPVLWTPLPVEGTAWGTTMPGFGVEQCLFVRAVLMYGNARLLSEPSEVVCVTPVDTFPPAAPKGLVAVGSEGGVSLIWEPNTDADLGGYQVLRGEIGPGGAAGPLAAVTGEPIRETTYRDTTARPGVRYVYAVVAVDTASPRNVSPESNRVEEGAR